MAAFESSRRHNRFIGRRQNISFESSSILLLKLETLTTKMVVYLVPLIAVFAVTFSTVQAQPPQLVRITSLNVQCGDSSMTVDIQFSQPFQGVIFSKGYFSHHECVYVQAGESSAGYRFVIPYDGCGTTAGGTALNTNGRPAQFLRNLSFEDGLMGMESNLINTTFLTNNNTSDAAESSNITTTGYIVDRTRRDVLFGETSNDTRKTTSTEEDLLLKKPTERSFYDMPADFGGGGGDPNAREFISAHSMFNNDESANFIPGEASPPGGAGLKPRQANFGRPPQFSPEQFNNNNPQPAYNINPTAAGFPPRPREQQTVVSFVPQQQQQPPVAVFSSPTNNVPVLQESAPAEERQQIVYSRTQQPIATPLPVVVSPTILPQGTKFMENVLIIQFDANIQEIWDVAKALRCEWHDNYHKRVTYKPMNVGSLDIVEAAFAGDNIGVWMTVQQGQGPFAPEVNGIVRIGQQLTLTIGIQDPSQKFDMRVLNCIASDGTRPAIQLVDEYGCVVRPKIMAAFQKTRNVGPQASVVSYATFQAFKFPDSVDVNIECSVEVCKHGCPKQCFSGESNGVDGLGARRAGRTDDGAELLASETQVNITIQQQPSNSTSISNSTSVKREKRQASSNEVGLQRKIKVVSMNDMMPFMEALRAVNENFSLSDGRRLVDPTVAPNSGDAKKMQIDVDGSRRICIAPAIFISSTILLFAALVVIVLVLVFLCTKVSRHRSSTNNKTCI